MTAGLIFLFREPLLLNGDIWMMMDDLEMVYEGNTKGNEIHVPAIIIK